MMTPAKRARAPVLLPALGLGLLLCAGMAYLAAAPGIPPRQGEPDEPRRPGGPARVPASGPGTSRTPAPGLRASDQDVDQDSDQDVDGTSPADGESQAERPGGVAMPHVAIDVEKRIVDVDAEVCPMAGMLELIVTTKGGKEHEACFAILAKPRHVMVGLLLIGLTPGSPARMVEAGEGYRHIDPTGSPVRVSVVYEERGKEVERPITDFVVSDETREPMDGIDFIFAGSRVVETEGGTRFAADLDGTVLSLVSFGTELIAYPTGASDSNESLTWRAHMDALPEEVKSVVIRMRPGGGAGKTR